MSNNRLQTNVSNNESAHNGCWHESCVETRNGEYHIVQDGIISKQDYSLLFENENGKYGIPVEVVDQLNLYNEVSLNSHVLRFLTEKGIRLALFNNVGNLLGYFVPESYYKDSKTVIAQSLEYSNFNKRLNTAIALETAMIHNLRSNLRYYSKKGNSLDQYISELSNGIRKIKTCKDIEDLMLEEARCKQIYYQSINTIVQNPDFHFEKRSKRPPLDALNAMMSFGNTLLYNRIQQMIWKTSLDSRIGILHASNKRHYSLNLDFADLFKPLVVDRVIFTLLNKKMIDRNSCFQINSDNSVYLNESGKKIFIYEFNKKMSSRMTVDGQKISYQQLMMKEIRKYQKHILDDSNYKPFKYY